MIFSKVKKIVWMYCFKLYLTISKCFEAVNKRKMAIMASKTPTEIELEQSDDTRYADRKWTFVYGL